VTAAAFGWTRADIATIARTSIESCFASADRRAEMLAAHGHYIAETTAGAGASAP
jgi:adenosine deaminase